MLLEGLHACLAELGRLEIQLFRGLQHGRLVFGNNLAHSAFQQMHDFFNPSVVFFFRNLAHAASQAPAYVIVEAGAVFAAQDGVRVDFEPAAAQRPVAPEEFEQAPCVHYRAVRAEVARAVLLHPAGEEHPGEGLGGDAYPGVGFAVFEQNVVAGLELLDEVVFEQQGVRLAVDHRVLNIRNLAYQDARFDVEPLGGYKVLMDAFIEVFGLAYVNNSPGRVAVAVHAGAVWQKLYFFFNCQAGDCSINTNILKMRIFG